MRRVCLYDGAIAQTPSGYAVVVAATLGGEEQLRLCFIPGDAWPDLASCATMVGTYPRSTIFDGSALHGFDEDGRHVMETSPVEYDTWYAPRVADVAALAPGDYAVAIGGYQQIVLKRLRVP